MIFVRSKDHRTNWKDTLFFNIKNSVQKSASLRVRRLKCWNGKIHPNHQHLQSLDQTSCQNLSSFISRQPRLSTTIEVFNMACIIYFRKRKGIKTSDSKQSSVNCHLQNSCREWTTCEACRWKTVWFNMYLMALKAMWQPCCDEQEKDRHLIIFDYACLIVLKPRFLFPSRS